MRLTTCPQSFGSMLLMVILQKLDVQGKKQTPLAEQLPTRDLDLGLRKFLTGYDAVYLREWSRAWAT